MVNVCQIVIITKLKSKKSIDQDPHYNICWRTNFLLRNSNSYMRYF